MSKHSKVCIGAHLSCSKGFLNAAEQSLSMGAHCFQIFTGSPKRLTFAMDALAQKPADKQAVIQRELATINQLAKLPASDSNYLRPVIHSPYYMNLCDASKQKLNVKLLVQELEMCELMGAIGVVIHTGTRKIKENQDLQMAYATFVSTIQTVLDTFKGKSRVLLETSAGQGNSIGVTMRDFGCIYNAFDNETQRQRLGIVIDTCHIYVAGYDVSTAKGVDAYVAELCQYVDKRDIRLIHLNDSAKELASKVDRHAPLGKGFIFKHSYQGLEALLGYFPNVPYVLETHDSPPYAQYTHEITKVKTLHARAPKRLRKRIHLREQALHLMRAAFTEMATLYYSKQDRIRGDAYSEAVFRMELLTPETLPTTKAACMAIHGIGENLSNKMLEIYYTGRLSKLDALKQDPNVSATIELLAIPGIGIKTVERYLAAGIKSLTDLKRAAEHGEVKLTSAQALGFTYIQDLHRRVPWKEAEQLNHHLSKLSTKNNDVHVELVGSFRRRKPDLGDIDVLATGIEMKPLLEHIGKAFEIVGYISKGSQKSALLVRIDRLVRHVDVLISNKTEFPYALLYFTGSKFFNIKLRTHAQQLGYSLSEHGLKPILKQFSRAQLSMKPSEVKTERDIFKALGVAYVAPEER